MASAIREANYLFDRRWLAISPAAVRPTQPHKLLLELIADPASLGLDVNQTWVRYIPVDFYGNTISVLGDVVLSVSVQDYLPMQAA